MNRQRVEEEDYGDWFQDNSLSLSKQSSQVIDLTDDNDLPPGTAKVPPSTSDDDINEDDESKLSQNLSYLNTVEKTKKSKPGPRRKGKDDDINELRVGEMVKIKLFGHSTRSTGRIIAIEGKFGRFHMSNTSYQEDTWHSLSEYKRITDEDDDDEEEEQDADYDMIEEPKMNYVSKTINYSMKSKADQYRYNSLVKDGEQTSTSLQSDLYFLQKHIQDQDHINNSSRIKWMKGFAIGKVLADHVQKKRTTSSANNASNSTSISQPSDIPYAQAKAIFSSSFRPEISQPRHAKPLMKLKFNPSSTISTWKPSNSLLPPRNIAPAMSNSTGNIPIPTIGSSKVLEIKTGEAHLIEQVIDEGSDVRQRKEDHYDKSEVSLREVGGGMKGDKSNFSDIQNTKSSVVTIVSPEESREALL